MRVMHGREGAWYFQKDYPGFIVLPSYSSVLLLNYRVLLKLKALGMRIEKTEAWIS